MGLNQLSAWIEAHPATVDVLMWTALLVLAWVTGTFTFLRNLTRKPRVQISESASRCFLESLSEFDGQKNAQRAALLLEIQVVNRSSAEIVVWALDVRVRRQRLFRRWGPRISAVSLPSRVRHTMGSGVKFVRNWFANFPDDMAQLTVDGHLPPSHATSGYALFVSFTYGNWNPALRGDRIRVRVSVELTAGKRIHENAWVQVTQDEEFFEGMVPGILDQVRHPTSWNLPLRHS